jgi:hypothetical protein
MGPRVLPITQKEIDTRFELERKKVAYSVYIKANIEIDLNVQDNHYPFAAGEILKVDFGNAREFKDIMEINPTKLTLSSEEEFNAQRIDILTPPSQTPIIEEPGEVIEEPGKETADVNEDEDSESAVLEASDLLDEDVASEINPLTMKTNERIECPAACGATFNSEAELRDHLIKEHGA